MGEKPFWEFCDLVRRPILGRSPLPLNEREQWQWIEAFVAHCEWVPVFFLWRLNLPDEGETI